VIDRALSIRVLGLALVVAGCRFSASAEDPYAGALPNTPSGGVGGEGSGGSAGTGGTGDIGGTGGTGVSGGSAGTGGTGGGGSGATGGSGTDSGADGHIGGGGTGGTGGSGAGSCQPATPPMGCDPVNNIGCLVPFSFCDIERSQAVATGKCVFPWSSTPPPLDGGSCFMDAMSSTCTPTSTCVDGSCREICYCDSDCPGGQCCTEPAPGSSTTFKLCTPC
jgi:hypothetical protein